MSRFPTPDSKTYPHLARKWKQFGAGRIENTEHNEGKNTMTEKGAGDIAEDKTQEAIPESKHPIGK